MKRILIVVDMQNDFIDGALGTPEAQAIVPNIVEKIKDEDEDTLILFTKDTHGDDYLETLEDKNLPIEHCIHSTDGWAIRKEIRSEWIGKETIIWDKKSSIYSCKNNTILKEAFGSSDLMWIISDYMIAHTTEDSYEIELVGLCTDICVISNAMMIKSLFPQIPVKVDAKCCAGVTPESHKIALQAMRTCQIEVIGDDEK